MTTTTIHLDNFVVDMLLGILPEEHVTPQPVSITVDATLRSERIPSLIEQTFDYKTLYDFIKKRVLVPTDLAETLAGDIVYYCLQHSAIMHAKVTVMKLKALPDTRVGVTIEGRNGA